MNINTDHIWTEVGRCGGKPYIRGHRFTVAQMLVELAQGCSVIATLTLQQEAPRSHFQPLFGRPLLR